jgi:urease accessory protein UreF
VSERVIHSDDNDPSTTGLLKEAIEEGRELIKLEVALARNDLESELTRARSAAIAFAVAACAVNVAIAMALFAIGVASHAEVAVGAVAAVFLSVIAAVVGAVGYRTISASFFQRTRNRIEHDIRELGEKAHGS